MENALIPATEIAPSAGRSLFFDIQAFADGQRMATLLSQSKLIPEAFRGNLPDCVIILELAQRLGASPLALMQNTYVVHGKPGFSAQFVIAMINSCGRYSPLRFKVDGDGDSKTCVAWAYELRSGEILEGPPVSIKTAKAEGWYGKNGSKWQTMPDLMLRYRAATFFGRMYAPELMMGMRTVEELRDTPPEEDRQANDIVATINAAASKTPQEAPQAPPRDEQPAGNTDALPDEKIGNKANVVAHRASVEKEIAALNKMTTSVGVDRWRMSNHRRIEAMGQDAAKTIMDHAELVYGALKADEEAVDESGQKDA